MNTTQPRAARPLRAARALGLALGLAVAPLAGCDLFEVDDRVDPNGPSREEILANPTDAILSALAVGVEAAARVDIHLYLTDVGVIGREYWVTSSADPRLTADLLGKAGSILDDNTFYTTRPWSARYRTIRDANTLIEGIGLNTTLSDAQKAGGRGWARTFIAHEYLMNLNLTYENGIRFIEPGADDPGPFVGYQAALDQIGDLLDQGAADLAASSGPFFFPVSSGFGGFATPDNFREVNRALAARVALYRGQNEEALDLLNETFLDVDENLRRGAYHVFSSGSGDLLNPFFLPQDNASGNAHLAHPSFVADLEADDDRISKVFDRGAPDTFDGLSSQYSENVYTSSTSPISIIRNAELILIRAEARARTGDLAGAVADLDVIRNEAGLPNYSGAMTADAVLAEVLRQRRYELYAEGHRWVDVRRFGLLGTLPIDRPEDDVWDRFPIPEAENTGGV
jgi:hypothetical protein